MTESPMAKKDDDKDKDKEKDEDAGERVLKKYVAPSIIRFGPLTILTGKAFALSCG